MYSSHSYTYWSFYHHLPYMCALCRLVIDSSCSSVAAQIVCNGPVLNIVHSHSQPYLDHQLSVSNHYQLNILFLPPQHLLLCHWWSLLCLKWPHDWSMVAPLWFINCSLQQRSHNQKKFLQSAPNRQANGFGNRKICAILQATSTMTFVERINKCIYCH